MSIVARVIDNDGNRLNCTMKELDPPRYEWSCDAFEIIVDISDGKFTRDEWLLMKDALMNMLDLGGSPETMRKLLNIYDKIEKELDK